VVDGEAGGQQHLRVHATSTTPNNQPSSFPPFLFTPSSSVGDEGRCCCAVDGVVPQGSVAAVAVVVGAVPDGVLLLPPLLPFFDPAEW